MALSGPKIRQIIINFNIYFSYLGLTAHGGERRVHSARFSFFHSLPYTLLFPSGANVMSDADGGKEPEASWGHGESEPPPLASLHSSRVVHSLLSVA